MARQERLVALGVEHTPICDMEFRALLYFRDPDNIALGLSTSDETAVEWYAEPRERDVPQEEIDTRLPAYLESLSSDPAPA